MYLNNADTLDEIITYGMNPLVELMNIFEDEILNDMYPDSREYILWIEIKAKALRMRAVSKWINDKKIQSKTEKKSF